MKIQYLLIIFIGLVFFSNEIYSGNRDDELKNLVRENNINIRAAEIKSKLDPLSVQYNNKGYEAYKKSEWKEAASLFNKSIEADDKNPFAHFNYACVLAIIHGSNSNNQILDEINTHLKKAGELDTYFAVKIFVDTDLDKIRIIPDLKDEYYPGGDCAPATYITYMNGRIIFEKKWDHTSDMSGYEDENTYKDIPPEAVYSGYYAVIGNIIYTFYPELQYDEGLDLEYNLFGYYKTE